MLNFVIDPHQFLKIKNFENDHECTREQVGAIGGKMTYTFTPTGIGTVVRAQCACGKSIDVTDYDTW